MAYEPKTHYELRLQVEIEIIEARIKELTQEKYALERQLVKARREGTALVDTNRKNSVTRAMIENRIIDALQRSKKPLSSADLLAESRYVNFELKETSFRTYIHRMKIKGLVQSAGRSGLWRLPRKEGPALP